MAGIIDTIKLAGVLILALPAALAGLEFVFIRGDAGTGGILIGLAVGLVVVERWLTMPSDVPGLVAKRAAGTVIGDPESESADDDTPTDSTSVTTNEEGD
ncbi:hypothetical protein C483_06877 [Natrialba hulunbeirensis JCM 10989]|uniref:Uncharacterized protein n=1 Tax=Natrialba hulunbeirensis JCM 10989 TaxID=1227493 RepID=M0A3F5_9EURY|nr:hypothetical protein [Natrialba hulunbeirensis]ELY92851.1 hypothetical protein C483_06877 [Natrialba hulunbeirensis JCM 10989]